MATSKCLLSYWSVTSTLISSVQISLGASEIVCNLSKDFSEAAVQIGFLSPPSGPSNVASWLQGVAECSWCVPKGPSASSSCHLQQSHHYSDWILRVKNGAIGSPPNHTSIAVWSLKEMGALRAPGDCCVEVICRVTQWAEQISPEATPPSSECDFMCNTYLCRYSEGCQNNIALG